MNIKCLIDRIKNKEKEESSINLKDFINFCKSHTLLIFLTILILFLAHGSSLFNNNIGIDTQLFLEDPTSDYNWLGIGRYGLLIEKVLLGLSSYSPYYAGAIFFIFLSLSNILIYYSLYKISNKDLDLLYLCIPLLAFTHPIFVEQFVFMLQYAEITFAIALTALATLFIFTWIKDKSSIYCLLGIICLVISFATYQSFVPLYICFCIFGFICMFYSIDESKKVIKIIVKLIISFIISLGIYELSVKLLPSYVSHIDEGFFWGKYPLRSIYEFIKGNIKEVILGRGIFYNKGYLICAILFFITAIINTENINKSFNKILYIVSVLAFIATPFYMTIAMGHAPTIRAQFILPFTEAFMMIYIGEFLFKHNYLKYIVIILTIIIFETQLQTTLKLYYTENMRNDSDIQYVYEIAKDMNELGITEGAGVVFIGKKEPRLNNVSQTGEIIGVSLFTMNYNVPPYYSQSSSLILRLFRVLGMKYYDCSPEQVDEAREYSKDMPIWPMEGSIVVHNGYVIVKLSESEF